MARKIPSLGRFLGVRALYAMAYGEISSSLYYALGITAVYALSLTPVVFAAAGFLFALAAAAYAEGGATIPEPGGASALRPAGVQRPRGLHRRVGDGARLRARDLAVGALPAVLRRRRAGAVRMVPGQHGRATAVRGRDRPRRHGRAHARGAPMPTRSASSSPRSTSSSRSGWRCSGSCSCSRRRAQEQHRPRHGADLELPRVLVPDRDDRLHRPREGGQRGRLWRRTPRRACPTACARRCSRSSSSTAPLRPPPSRRSRATRTNKHSRRARRSWRTRWVDTPMLGLAHAIGEKGPSWVESALRIGVGLTACTILLMAIATSFSGCARLAEAMGRHTQLPPVFGRTSRRVLAPPAAIISVSVLAIGFLVVGSFYLRRGDPDAGVALLVRDPDRVHADPGRDHLASHLRARPAATVHDEGQRLDRPPADPRDVGGRRRARRSPPGWSRSARIPARASSARCG